MQRFSVENAISLYVGQKVLHHRNSAPRSVLGRTMRNLRTNDHGASQYSIEVAISCYFGSTCMYGAQNVLRHGILLRGVCSELVAEMNVDQMGKNKNNVFG